MSNLKGHLERARRSFEQKDTNRDGKLSVEEFSSTIRPHLTQEDFDQLMKQVNLNNDDEISWEEFLNDYENNM